MGSNFSQINIFIINPQDIDGIFDIFPKFISRNEIYEERLFEEKTFNWRGIFFNSINLDNILDRTKEIILTIKERDKLQNNIIIAKNISKEPLFNKIKEINKELDNRCFVIYISNEKLDNIKQFDNRMITNIFGDKINDKEYIKEKLKYILSMKDCIFNQRTLEFRQALNFINAVPTRKFLNILIIGPSRAGKSTLCNTLLNKYEALESSASKSVTQVVNEYSNDYLHLYDTPGITINDNLGNTSKLVIKCLEGIFKKVEDSLDDMHIILFVLKHSPNLENITSVLKFLDKENIKRTKNNMKKIPIIFIINEKKTEDNEQLEDKNDFDVTVKSLKNHFEEKKIKTLYTNYKDEIVNDDEVHNIIRVDILKENNAIVRIFQKICYYIRKNNPFSPKLFENIEEIKKNFGRLNLLSNNLKLNKKEKDNINKELKKNRELCQKVILTISQENSFFNKIFSLDNILKSSEIEANVSISICCITTFGTGFIPIPFVDIPLVYAQQAAMILSIAFSYGFDIDEIPFKAAIGAAFGISVDLNKKDDIVDKAIAIETGEKMLQISVEAASKQLTEKIGIKMVEEGGKQIQENLIKNIIKEGGIKITSQFTEKVAEYGTGILSKKVSSEITKEGSEIIVKEIGKKFTTEAGEEIGKITTSKITKEIATELMKQSGKTTATESAAETSKFIPIIGTIVGGTISGTINFSSTLVMGLKVRKFFRHLVLLTSGAGYIINKKKIIDEIFEYMEKNINNEINQTKIEYI